VDRGTLPIQTPVALVEGLADGVVLVRDMERGTHFELTPDEARAIARAFNHAAFGVEEWQKHARGYHRIVVQRDEVGVVRVTSRDATLPMRLSKLRRARRCRECGESVISLWIVERAAQKEEWCHGRPVHSVEICEPCVERLANAPTTIAEVLPITERKP
jgi:hypothetical protein